MLAGFILVSFFFFFNKETDHRRDEDHSDTDSQQSQAKHYHTLQEIYKRPKPNKEAVAQLLDLEFDARRAFINSDCFKDQDRPSKILQAYPCFRELHHVSNISENIFEFLVTSIVFTNVYVWDYSR